MNLKRLGEAPLSENDPLRPELNLGKNKRYVSTTRARAAQSRDKRVSPASANSPNRLRSKKAKIGTHQPTPGCDVEGRDESGSPRERIADTESHDALRYGEGDEEDPSGTSV